MGDSILIVGWYIVIENGLGLKIIHFSHEATVSDFLFSLTGGACVITSQEVE